MSLGDFKVGVGVSVGCQCWRWCLPRPPNTMTGVDTKCKHQCLFNTGCLWMVLNLGSKHQVPVNTDVNTGVDTGVDLACLGESPDFDPVDVVHAVWLALV